MVVAAGEATIKLEFASLIFTLGTQVYELAPFALILAISPEHKTVLSAMACKFGKGTTVTCCTAVEVQEFNIPITVYNVVTFGDAITLLAKGLSKEAEGNQV
jgi:hypothetical protein